MKKKDNKEKVKKISKKRSKTTKKGNVFSSLFKKIKNIFVKIVSREYTVGILDILILLVVASIVSSTATGYVMNKEFEKNVKYNSIVSENPLDKFISVYLKVGADGKNFGHITSKYVCEEFEAQTGIHLDKKKVELPVINSVGIFTASVKLDKDIIATFEVNVIEK